MRKTRTVRPEELYTEEILSAAKEGRLQVVERKETVCREQVKKDVLAYVERIRPYVLPKFRLHIDKLWELILSEDKFMALLMPSTKARKFRLFNKYNVMRIICVLLNNGVYEAKNGLKYNSILEQTDKDTPYRKYLTTGLEQQNLVAIIMKMVGKFNN